MHAFTDTQVFVVFESALDFPSLCVKLYKITVRPLQSLKSGEKPQVFFDCYVNLNALEERKDNIFFDIKIYKIYGDIQYYGISWDYITIYHPYRADLRFYF